MEEIPDYQTALDYFDSRLDRISEKKKREGYDSLTKPERMIYLIMNYDADVRNGGIIGFLDNSASNYCFDLLQFFREINAAAVANDLQDVLNILKKISPLNPHDLIDDDAFHRAPSDLRRDFSNAEMRTTDYFYEYEPTVVQLLFAFLKRQGF